MVTMVSFASPLFWQIHYLVTNLTKKNFKANVAEINQLITLYGEDIRIFLLSCLIKEIDFRELKSTNHKDSLKIQILSHEITQAFLRPNFTTFLCQSIENAAISSISPYSTNIGTNNNATANFVLNEDFLLNFSRLLKLTIPQQITLGVAVGQSKIPIHASEAIRFLRLKLPEIPLCGQKLSPNVLHSLVYLLKSHKEFKEDPVQSEAFVASLELTHPNNVNNIDIIPLKYFTADQPVVDILPAANGDYNNQFFASVVEETLKECRFFEMMEDIGFNCTRNAQVFRELLCEVDQNRGSTSNNRKKKYMNPQDIAEMIIMLTVTYDSKNTNKDTQAVLSCSLSSYNEANSPKDNNSNLSNEKDLETWNIDVVKNVIAEDYQPINWEKVCEFFDNSNFSVSNVQQIEYFFNLLQKLSNKNNNMKYLFVSQLLKAKWKNLENQVAFIKIAIENSSNQFSFVYVGYTKNITKYYDEALDSNTYTNYNKAWWSLDLMNLLLIIAETNHVNHVVELFENVINVCNSTNNNNASFLLLCCLVQSKPKWSGLKLRLFCDILYGKIDYNNHGNIITTTNSSNNKDLLSLLRFLWKIDANFMLESFVKCYNKALDSCNDIHVFHRFYSVYMNINDDSLNAALQSPYFSFSILVAIISANHETVNLINFLTERLTRYRTSFASSLLLFIKRWYAKAIPKVNLNSSNLAFFTIESLSLCLQALITAQECMNPWILAEFKKVLNLCASAHPLISTICQSNIVSSSPAENSPDLFDMKEAIDNKHLESLDGVEPSLKSDKINETNMSSDEIEEKANAYFQRIYTSEQSIEDVILMLKKFQNSDDPIEKNIFACMIHNLFDEYRFFDKYPDNELRITGILFGKLIENELVNNITLTIALRYVLEALKKSPAQSRISNSSSSKLFSFGFYALQQFIHKLKDMPQYCQHLMTITHLRATAPDLMQTIAAIHQKQLTVKPELIEAPSLVPFPPLPSPKQIKTNTAPTPAHAPVSVHVPTPVANQGTLASNNINTVMDVDGIFGDESVSDDESNKVVPAEKIQDRVHFIINNVTVSNIDLKINETKEILLKEYYFWFSNYLIIKRISSQPNYHYLYLLYIEKLNDPLLENLLLKKTVNNIKKLIVSSTIISNSQERSLLKNLGLWLGLFTLSRNKPLLTRLIDIKELLYKGYETGRLIVITPFIAKLLDSCKKSKIFVKPNPWLMGIVLIMKEIYELKDLKLNIKFEIEVLLKTLKVKIDELVITKKTLHLRNGPPKPPTNLDFNCPKTTITHLSVNANSSGPSQTTPLTGPTVAPATPTNTAVNNEYNTVIPNLSSYVSINSNIILFQEQPSLRCVVSVAVDRAIREIISPVVERSVTIAVITTKKIIKKDFITDKNEKKMKKAAYLMVKNLAGSLALVTCKEPLRLAISNHLRNLLMTNNSNTAINESEIEKIVNVCANENLELSCMLIEKASMEKSIRDIDENLVNNYNIRRKYDNVSLVNSSNLFIDPMVYGSPSEGNDFAAMDIGKNDRSNDEIDDINNHLPDCFHIVPGKEVSEKDFLVYDAYNKRVQAKSGNASSVATAAGIAGNNKEEVQVVALERFWGIFEKYVGNNNNSNIMVWLNEIKHLVHQLPTLIRDDIIVVLAQHVFKFLYDSTNSGNSMAVSKEHLQRMESSVSVLVCLNELFCNSTNVNKLKKEISNNWILHTTNSLFNNVNSGGTISSVQNSSHYLLLLHCEIMILLLRNSFFHFTNEMDIYLAKSLLIIPDKESNINSTNIIIVEFLLLLLKKSLNLTAVNMLKEIPHTIETLERLPFPPSSPHQAAIITLLTALRANHSSGFVSNVPSASQDSTVTSSANSPAASDAPISSHNTAFRRTVSGALEHWFLLLKNHKNLGENSTSTNEKILISQYLLILKNLNLLKDEETIMLFIKTSTLLCSEAFASDHLESNKNENDEEINYDVIDGFSSLLILLVKFIDPNPNVKLQLINKTYMALTRAFVQTNEINSTTANSNKFDGRAYFRLFLNLSKDFTTPDVHFDVIICQVITVIASAYHTLQPIVFPSFAFHWVTLISHRNFLPILLLTNPNVNNNTPQTRNNNNYLIMHQLLIDFLLFLEPYLRNVTMTKTIRLLYKGFLRIMLLLLHDFPDFLSDYYYYYCDILPFSCVQLRNLILSAFPRNMRLPDPLTPNLSISLLPEIKKKPKFPNGSLQALLVPVAKKNPSADRNELTLKDELLFYLNESNNSNNEKCLQNLVSRLIVSDGERAYNSNKGMRYLVPVLNAMTIFIIDHAIGYFEEQENNIITIMNNTDDDARSMIGYCYGNNKDLFNTSKHIQLFFYVCNHIDNEGKYLLFSAISNHLRFPNSHTHFSSVLLLHIFHHSVKDIAGYDINGDITSDTKDIISIKEQITRVLLERLISNRPHPWGLLITFIELIRNAHYHFWDQTFLECSKDIKLVFDDVARSCMGGTNSQPSTPTANTNIT